MFLVSLDGAALRRSGACQILMDKGDRNAAFADGGATRLTRLEPNVATGEHARYAGFDQIGVAAFLPASRFDHIAAREDIAAWVARDFGRQPASFLRRRSQ